MSDKRNNLYVKKIRKNYVSLYSNKLKKERKKLPPFFSNTCLDLIDKIV